ncbi:MAG TPA: fatty acid--CoA ligase family protein [Mycobacteriales bacterium]|nr:fatty acid--CoA ligase family protein [Mycobacteriales bacterium]
MLLELIDAVVVAEPDRELLVTAERSLTYADVATRARAVAAGLAAAGIDRFGVACATPVDTIVALVAASAIGAEPCVYPRCDLSNSELLATEFGHTTVLVSEPDTGLAPARTVASLEQPASELGGATEDPVLILTSGTTGRPKGTRHRWSRLLAAAHPDRRGGSRRWLLAYNLNQYAGLQVMLHVLGTGDTLVVPDSPQPRHALAAIQAHGVTHISATPTFWRFLLQLLSGDPAGGVPALQQITIGGEAVSDELLDGLRRLFPDAQISQVYASSEFGSSVSVTDGRAGLPLSVLDRPAEAPVHFRIVDGELQARSTVGMQGYHGSEDRDEGWHSTGDLVAVEGDRIRFVGRTTEVINVGGVKVYPLPIEAMVAAVPGVVAAAVFGHPNPVTGSIVAVDVVGAEGIDEDELKSAIRTATASLPPAQRPRRIRIVEELNIANNKVRRTGDGGVE